MKVTKDMTTEGGQPMSQLADFLDEDGTGVQAIAGNGIVRIIADSTAYPNKSAYLDADDAEAFGRLLIERAAEARARR